MTPTVSVITGTWNRLPLLQAMMASCRASLPKGIDLEFVVCDGGSTDGTLEWLAEQPDTITIEHGELRGAIRAFNDAAAKATGKYVLVANDDVRVMNDSLFRAVMHLEENPTCGAVPFADNRHYGYERDEYEVAIMPVIMPTGQQASLPYIQVGLVRRWLGDLVGWWGADDPEFPARTYAGDNYLTAKIYELGYAITPLDGVQIHDEIHEDALRAANRSSEPGNHPDSNAYYALYPIGPKVQTIPQVENPDKKQLRILYLPIYEHGANGDEYLPHVKAQHAQKCGLRKAFQDAGALVYELDYLRYDYDPQVLFEAIQITANRFKPHLMFTQLHSADLVTAQRIHAIRADNPGMVWVNWNGDYWPESQLAKPMLDVLRQIDLTLVVNGEVQRQYEEMGIPSAYWQIAFEPVPVVPDMPAHDVVFLGNLYSPKRYALARLLKDLPYNIGIYGNAYGGDFETLGDTTYDFTKGRGLYRAGKIAINDNQFLDAPGFFSNRVFEIMAAGGAILFQQRVRMMKEYTHLLPGVHFVDFTDLEELSALIAYWLAPERDKEREAMARAAYDFVRHFHSFDARVQTLFRELLPRVAQLRERVALRYIGRSPTGAGGVYGRKTNNHYIHQAGQPLIVNALDAPELVNSGMWTWAEGGYDDAIASAVKGI